MKKSEIRQMIKEEIQKLNEGQLSIDEFIKEINILRLKNKNNWYQWTGTVDGKKVKIKGYKTWLQIFKVSGIDNSNPMERNVKQFKDDLQKAFN